MRSPRSIFAVAVALSALLHGLPLLLQVAAAKVRLLRAPVSVELLPPPPPRRAPPPAPQAKAEPPPVKRHGNGPGGARKPRPPKPVPPPPPPPPETADLRHLAPGDARIVVLLRGDRLRASPHRVAVEALLGALPDYHTLLDGTGLTALDDFGALLIATANPRDVTATFVAAQHADEERIHKALAGRTLPEWDPRQIRRLGPTFSILTRPDDATPLPPRPDGGPPAPVSDGGIVDPREEWLGELARFAERADAPGSPSLLVTASDLHLLVRLQQNIPTPQSLALAATAEAAPAVRLQLRFATAVEAERMAAEWPAIVQRYKAGAGLLGLGGLLDGLKVQQTEALFEVQGTIGAAQMALALSWAKALLPTRPLAAAAEAATPPGDPTTTPLPPGYPTSYPRPPGYPPSAPTPGSAAAAPGRNLDGAVAPSPPAPAGAVAPKPAPPVGAVAPQPAPTPGAAASRPAPSAPPTAAPPSVAPSPLTHGPLVDGGVRRPAVDSGP